MKFHYKFLFCCPIQDKIETLETQNSTHSLRIHPVLFLQKRINQPDC